MNSFSLKMIAIITMLIDHTAAALISPEEPIYLIMRMIGRLAFPIFCFLIVEGFYHTKNVNKYMFRLGIFAIVSEIPFDLALFVDRNYFDHQNVYFTLLIGLAVIYALHKVSLLNLNNIMVSYILQFLIIFAGCALATIIKTDYSFMGVILILTFYLFHNKKGLLIISVLFVTIFLGGLFEGIASLSLIPILLYNGKKGPSAKYVFYAFYPVHIFILYLISTII